MAITQVSVTGATSIDTGEDGDAIAISDCKFTGATTIKTDGGGDAMAISGGATSRTKFVGKLTISTGDGGDALALFKIDSKALSIDTGNDGDAISLSDMLVAGDLSMKTGGDGDAFAVSGIIQLGGGATLFDVGADTDAMAMSQCSFSGATTINLGDGGLIGNTLSINDVSFNNAFTLNSQGPGDTIAIETSIALAGQTTFAKAAKFNLGAATTIFISTPNTKTKSAFLSSAHFPGL